MAWWHRCSICGDQDHQCDPPPSAHVVWSDERKDWWCQCCEAVVDHGHICACERGKQRATLKDLLKIQHEALRLPSEVNARE